MTAVIDLEALPVAQAMMRLLHVAIFLATVSCITEFVLKFVKVRVSRVVAPNWSCLWVCWRMRACHVLQAGRLPGVR